MSNLKMLSRLILGCQLLLPQQEKDPLELLALMESTTAAMFQNQAGTQRCLPDEILC